MKLPTSPQDPPKPPPICPASAHAGYFADGRGELTIGSIRQAESNIGALTATTCLFRGRAIRDMCSQRGLEPTPENLVKIQNIAHSGIWRDDGSFDEEKFKEMMTLAHELENDEGGVLKVITERGFFKFLEMQRDGKRVDDTMVTVCCCIPISYRHVTNPSVEDLFKVFSDVQVKESGKMVRGITEPTIRRFYTDPLPLMKEKEAELRQLQNESECSPCCPDSCTIL